MRILQGLKYTVVDQFKILLYSILVVFGIFIALIAIFSRGQSFTLPPEMVPAFVWFGFIILIFMGLSYTPIYFRTLIQTGFTRLEIFIIQAITDFVIVFSGFVIFVLSISMFTPINLTSVTYDVGYVTISINPLFMFFMVILGLMGTRTLMNCFGLIINKFNNKFAGMMTFFGAYLLWGFIMNLIDVEVLFELVTKYGILINIVYLLLLLCVEFFIMKKHNSKPITK